MRSWSDQTKTWAIKTFGLKHVSFRISMNVVRISDLVLLEGEEWKCQSFSSLSQHIYSRKYSKSLAWHFLVVKEGHDDHHHHAQVPCQFVFVIVLGARCSSHSQKWSSWFFIYMELRAESFWHFQTKKDKQVKVSFVSQTTLFYSERLNWILGRIEFLQHF